MAADLIRRLQQARVSKRPLVMGIVNVTPDSFSDGGRFDRPDAAVEHAMSLVEQGADLLDIGGESTRPGAAPVSADSELARVLPVIEALAALTSTPISVDTTKPEVMRAAIAAGAGLINDVNALRADDALTSAGQLGVPVCLMHMQGEPRTMQAEPRYRDVVAEVRDFLLERVEACVQAGLPRHSLIIDPGFGFGKTLQHNLALLSGLKSLVDSKIPVLAGLSRKSMLGWITGRERADERLAASLAAALFAADQGAAIVRVHDVAETVDALKVRNAILDSAAPLE